MKGRDQGTVRAKPLHGIEGQNKADTCLLLRLDSDLTPYLKIMKGRESDSTKTSMLTALLQEESDPTIRQMFRPHTTGDRFQFTDIPENWDEVAAALVPDKWRRKDWILHTFGDAAAQKAHELDITPAEKNRFMFLDDFKMKLYDFRWGRGGAGGGGGGREPTAQPSIGAKLHIPVQDIYTIILEEVKEEALGAQGILVKSIQRPISRIHWQVTHPANFAPGAKELVRKSAEAAGIKTSQTGSCPCLSLTENRIMM